jgi:phage terminase small subunit
MEPAKQEDAAPDHLRSAMAQLSPMERKAVLGVIEGKSKTRALIDAGYSESTAIKRQQMIFGRERVQDAFIASFEGAGISVDRLARLLKDGLEATRILGMRNNGEPYIVPDWRIRHRYLETVLKIKGAYPDKTVRHVEETYEQRLRRLKKLRDRLRSGEKRKEDS